MHAMLASMPHACERLTHHPPCRLLDIVHADQKLYLVFEFLDVDLKRYMEAGNSQGTPLTLELCQVCAFHYCLGAPAPPLPSISPARTPQYAMPILPLSACQCVRPSALTGVVTHATLYSGYRYPESIDRQAGSLA